MPYEVNTIITGEGPYHEGHRIHVVKITQLDPINRWIRLRCITCNQHSGWGFYSPGTSAWEHPWQH